MATCQCYDSDGEYDKLESMFDSLYFYINCKNVFRSQSVVDKLTKLIGDTLETTHIHYIVSIGCGFSLEIEAKLAEEDFEIYGVEKNMNMIEYRAFNFVSKAKHKINGICLNHLPEVAYSNSDETILLFVWPHKNFIDRYVNKFNGSLMIMIFHSKREEYNNNNWSKE